MKKRFFSFFLVLAILFTSVANVLAFNGGAKINFSPYSGQKEYRTSDWFSQSTEDVELKAYEDLTEYDIRWNAFILILRTLQAQLKSDDYSLISANGATLKEFADVNSLVPEAVEEARVLKGLGILSGRTEKNGNLSMQMSSYITRAEVAKIVAIYSQKFFKVDKKRNSPEFNDVSESHWANNYISYCYEREFLDGRSKKYFDPDGNITKEEIIKILINISEESDISIESVAKALNETYAITTRYAEENSNSSVSSKKIVPYEYSYTVKEGKEVIVKVKYNSSKTLKVTNTNSNISLEDKSISNGIAKIVVKGEREGTGVLKFEYTTGSAEVVYIPIFVTGTNINKVKSISIDKSTIYLDKGETYSLSNITTVNPYDADIYYASENSDIVSVSYNRGVLKANKKGETYIHIMSNNITKKVKVIVGRSYYDDDDEDYRNISLIKTYGTLYVGSTFNLKTNIKYIDGRKVTYESSNENIASVTTEGIVKAKRKGNVTIKAKCDGVTVKYELTVINGYDSTDEVEEIRFEKTYTKIKKGETFNLDDIVYTVPSYASKDDIRYYSLNEDIAIVDKYTGVIKGLSKGYTLIKVSINSVFQYFDVYVEEESEELPIIVDEPIKFYLEEVNLNVGLTFNPYSLLNKTDGVKFSLSDYDIATLKDDKVVANKKGDLILTAKDDKGNYNELIIHIK